MLESNGFAFLQDKVRPIQESDAKYKKPATRKRRAAAADKAPATKPAAKRRQTKKTEAEPAATAAVVAAAPIVDSKAKAPMIQEDDDYDESESE